MSAVASGADGAEAPQPPGASIDEATKAKQLEGLFLFALVWSTGATCDITGRVKFDQFFRCVDSLADDNDACPGHGLFCSAWSAQCLAHVLALQCGWGGAAPSHCRQAPSQAACTKPLQFVIGVMDQLLCTQDFGCWWRA